MKSIAIIAEDLSLPLDEGFKKTSAAVAASIAGLGIATHVLARRSGGVALEASRLPANKMLLGSAFSRRLRSIRPEAILYIPEAAATAMSLLRASLVRCQAGGPGQQRGTRPSEGDRMKRRLVVLMGLGR